ncbi:MAG: STAS domain-containing protein [Gammaproteobacteria bacterium]|nr:STAS domain-containing protein [Gammaproteobacteria bacterium]
MKVILTYTESILVAQFNGSLDTVTAPEAETQLMNKVDEGAKFIVIDFGMTEYIASSGLRVLLKLSRTLKKQGGRVSLCRGNQQVQEVLEISGFLQIFEHFPTLEEAMNSVTMA